MDDNEVLDVQPTDGEDNGGIVTDGLEPEVIDPNEGGNAGGTVTEDDEEGGDDPVNPSSDDENPEESNDDAKLKAHKYYCMQMMQIMPGL